MKLREGTSGQGYQSPPTIFFTPKLERRFGGRKLSLWRAHHHSSRLPKKSDSTPIVILGIAKNKNLVFSSDSDPSFRSGRQTKMVSAACWVPEKYPYQGIDSSALFS